MLRIERIRSEVYNHDGTRDCVCDLQVSTAEELPALDEQLDTIIFKAGCIAQVIQGGGYYTLDDDGEWYDADGNAASDSADSLSVSPSLSIGKVGLGKVALEPTEPEAFEPDELEFEDVDKSKPTETEQEVTEDADVL